MISDTEIFLESPDGSPQTFKVSIISYEHSSRKTFKISSKAAAAEEKTLSVSAESSSHETYLDLFQRICQNFGFKPPRNRQNTSPAFEADFPYQLVLSENLDKKMFYGYGDPAVLEAPSPDGNTFYLISTSNDAANAFPVLKSSDLKNWSFCRYIFPEGEKPEWAAEGEYVSDYWAPEMHLVGNEFRTYFVARDKNTRELCIGMSRSSSPEGPYLSGNEPIISGNVIDPHLFVKDKDEVFLFWKDDNNDLWPQKLANLLHDDPALIRELFRQADDQKMASFIITLWPWAKELPAMERFFVLQILIEAIIGAYADFEKKLAGLAAKHPAHEAAISELLKYMKTPMYMQQLSEDGSRLCGERAKILENDLEWEAHLIEGMWVTEHQGKYYLFYAGNDFSTDQYGIGVAVADDLKGPYKKQEKQLLKSTGTWWAPGHPSVIKNDGKHIMFLHAYFPGNAGYKKFRALLKVDLELENGRVKIA